MSFSSTINAFLTSHVYVCIADSLSIKMCVGKSGLDDLKSLFLNHFNRANNNLLSFESLFNSSGTSLLILCIWNTSPVLKHYKFSLFEHPFRVTTCFQRYKLITLVFYPLPYIFGCRQHNH